MKREEVDKLLKTTQDPEQRKKIKKAYQSYLHKQATEKRLKKNENIQIIIPNLTLLDLILSAIFLGLLIILLSISLIVISFGILNLFF